MRKRDKVSVSVVSMRCRLLMCSGELGDGSEDRTVTAWASLWRASQLLGSMEARKWTTLGLAVGTWAGCTVGMP
eukprot:gene21339-biopygen7120